MPPARIRIVAGADAGSRPQPAATARAARRLRAHAGDGDAPGPRSCRAPGEHDRRVEAGRAELRELRRVTAGGLQQSVAQLEDRARLDDRPRDGAARREDLASPGGAAAVDLAVHDDVDAARDGRHDEGRVDVAPGEQRQRAELRRGRRARCWRGCCTCRAARCSARSAGRGSPPRAPRRRPAGRAASAAPP